MIAARFKISESEAKTTFDFTQQSLLNLLKEKNIQLDLNHEVVKLSFLNALKCIIFNGFEFNQEPEHFYVQAKNMKVIDYTDKGAIDRYVKVLGFSESPYGKLKIAMDHGTVTFAYPPVVVYEGDVYEKKTVNNVTTINHEPKGLSKKFKAVYVVLKVHDQLVSYDMDLNDFVRLSTYKAKQTKGDLSGSFYAKISEAVIDDGFAKAKVLKHALKTLKQKGHSSAIEFVADEIDDYETKPLIDF